MLNNRTDAYRLLRELGAPDRLLRHVQLVGEAADELILEYEERQLQFGRTLIELGVAVHDAGKILHPSELVEPGSLHESAGRDLLLAHGVQPEVAQCCVSHAAWDADGTSFEELTVALSDKLWKGKREPELELRIVDAVAGMQGLERWHVFPGLDEVFEGIAAGGADRLVRSRFVDQDALADIAIPRCGFAAFILAFARKHGISAVPLPIDRWALMATRLTSDGDVEAPDEVEQSAIALKRAGIITGPQMGKLVAGYLREHNLRPSTAMADHCEAIRLAVARHGGENPRVFGSVVRGEDSGLSDLDLLIDPTPRLTLITLGALQLELEALLGVRIDIVTSNGLSEKIRVRVLAEARPV